MKPAVSRDPAAGTTLPAIIRLAVSAFLITAWLATCSFRPSTETAAAAPSTKAAAPGVCGELLALGYRLADQGQAWSTRSIFASPPTLAGSPEQSTGGKVTHLDLLTLEGRRLERYLAEPSLKVIDPEDPTATEPGLRAGGYEHSIVRLTLSERGYAARVEQAPAGVAGRIDGGDCYGTDGAWRTLPRLRTLRLLPGLGSRLSAGPG